MVPRTSSSKPNFHAKLPDAQEKGSSKAQKLDSLFNKNPQALKVFFHRNPAFSYASLKPPVVLERLVNRRGGESPLHKLAQKYLTHSDEGVRRAARCILNAAPSATGSFDLTQELRFAVRKLANPDDKSFDDYQAAKQVEIKGGFGKHSLGDLATKAYRPFISLHGSEGAAPVTEQAPVKKPDMSEIDGLLAGAAPAHFAAATPAELDAHYKLLTRNHDAHTGPFSDTDAVDEFTQQMRQAHDYVEPETHGQVSDLVRFIRSGNTEKLSGDRLIPLNQLGGRKFDGPSGRLEALHHLCFNTSFLRDMKPGQAAVFMGVYEELAQQYKDAMREQSV